MRLSQLKFGQAFLYGPADDLCVYGRFDGKAHIFFMTSFDKTVTMNYGGDCEVKPVVMPWMLKALKANGFDTTDVERALNNYYKLSRLDRVGCGSWFKHNGKDYMKINYPQPNYCGTINRNHEFEIFSNDLLVEVL